MITSSKLQPSALGNAPSFSDVRTANTGDNPLGKAAPKPATLLSSFKGIDVSSAKDGANAAVASSSPEVSASRQSLPSSSPSLSQFLRRGLAPTAARSAKRSTRAFTTTRFFAEEPSTVFDEAVIYYLFRIVMFSCITIQLIRNAYPYAEPGTCRGPVLR